MKTVGGIPKVATNTYGGGCDQRAVIGHAPEARDWTPYMPTHYPEINPTARIEAFATVDSGISRPTSIGPGAWLFKHSHVGHDAIVGAACEISTGAIVGGYAEIGEGAKIGLGAVIRPRVKVGVGARVGMGAIVTKDVPAHETWVGNPARKLEGA